MNNKPAPIKSRAVEKDAKKAGISKYAYNQACTMLGVEPRKVGNNENGYWEIYFPEESDNNISDQ